MSTAKSAAAEVGPPKHEHGRKETKDEKKEDQQKPLPLSPLFFQLRTVKNIIVKPSVAF
jgi:hypothetical protein